jgi:hypothetical protein
MPASENGPNLPVATFDVASGLVVDRNYTVLANNNAAAFIAFSAEL